MSKYSKIMTMKNGGKMEIKTASVGLFAKLVSRLPAYQTGLRKNVDMVGISTDAIRKGAAKKAFPERFEKASKAYQQGNKEMLTGMKLRGPDLDLPKGVASETKKYAGRSVGAAGTIGAGAVIENETGVIDKLKKLFTRD